MKNQVGKVTHYFNNINVAIIKLSDKLTAGETVHFKGHTSDFDQVIDSMQIDHSQVESAKKGQEVGVKVSEHTRVGDDVLRAES